MVIMIRFMGRSFETGFPEAASLHRLAELVGRRRENLSAAHGEPSPSAPRRTAP
jgi:hypothetical protein